MGAGSSKQEEAVLIKSIHKSSVLKESVFFLTYDNYAYKHYTSSIFLRHDIKVRHTNNDKEQISKHHLLSSNIQNLPNNILKTRRNKRYANLDSITAKSEPKYLKLNDDMVGDNFVEEDLLPFYRPTKYFLSPQLSIEHEAQSTHEKTPSGKFGTSTITINDVEKEDV